MELSMKKLLLPLAALACISCSEDGADITLGVNPDTLKIGDTAFFIGSIKATSKITEQNMNFYFTDTAQTYTGFFKALEKDSIESDQILLDRNNYRLGFVVQSDAVPGKYNGILTVQVGGASPSQSAPFTIVEKADTTTAEE